MVVHHGTTLVVVDTVVWDHPEKVPDDYGNIPRPRRQVLLDLFVEHGVSTYLCGHWHRNGRARHGDLEIVVVGPVGYPLGDDPSGFLVVDVDDAGVHHRYTPLTESG